MATKGQLLTEEEKLKHKDALQKWLESEEGIQYYKKLEDKQKLKIEEYYKTPKLCLTCNKPLLYEKRSGKFCSQSCAATHRNTGRKMSEEQKEKISNAFKQKVIDGTFLHPTNKIVGIKITKTCICCKQEFQVLPCHQKKQYCSKKCYLLAPNKKGGPGGYRKGSGVGKHGWYKNYWCDSSYELAFVIYNIDHNINFSRNKQGFEYDWEGKKHLYYPDFMIDDGSYIEIKGFWSEQHEAKIKNFPHKLTILFKKDMKPYLDYVISKYGKDFLSLYEGNPYKDKKDNICKVCGQPCKNKFCSRSCAGKERARIKHTK